MKNPPLKFNINDKVKIDKEYWGETDQYGIVVEAYEDATFYCGDYNCCGEPCNWYTIKLENGELEKCVSEYYLELAN